MCFFKCVLKLPAWEDAKSHWLHLFCFSPLCIFKCIFKLPAQKDAIVTLVAFVWFFSTMFFQMCLQMACLNGCKITLVAFVCPFSTVGFHMNPQTVCTRACIIALIAFVWFWCVFNPIPTGVFGSKFTRGGGQICPHHHVFAYTRVCMCIQVLIFCDFSSFLVWKRVQKFSTPKKSPFSQELKKLVQFA